MIVTIDTDSIKELGITPNEYVYLASIVNEIELEGHFLGIKTARFISRELLIADEKGNVSPTEKAFNLFQIPVRGVTVPTDPRMNVPAWIEDYRKLFPKGVRSGGYPVRGSKKGCLLKMERFVKDNPQYTKDMIMNVTAEYVDRKRRQSYQHMKLADYFIDKDGVSMLAAECEEKMSDIQTSDEPGIVDWGRDV